MAIILFRTIIVFIAIVASMRIMGKRQLGQLEPFELVVAVLISDMAAHPLQDIGIPLINGLLPILVLLCCELIISGLSMRSAKLRIFLAGRPSILVEKGVINQKEMEKNRFTLDELTEELRKQGIIDISTVQWAVLETDGTLNTVVYPAQRPLTPQDMNLPVQDTGIPMILINNGRIMEDNLHKAGLNRTWLQRQLVSRGVTDASKVYLFTVDQAKNIYFQKKEANK